MVRFLTILSTIFLFALFIILPPFPNRQSFQIMGPPSSQTSPTYWAGAKVFTQPNTGVRGTFNVQSFEVSTGCVAFWVSDDASNNIWSQVGYYICSDNVPIAFYQIWALGNMSIVGGGTTSVITGNHTFSLSLQSGTTWAFYLDSTIFGTFNENSSSSRSSYPVYSLSEETSGFGPTTFPQENFSIALQTLFSGMWSTPPSATAFYSGGTWGIAGNIQNPSVPFAGLSLGGDLPKLAGGTLLWNSTTYTASISSPFTIG
jgi:hypothetical protein